MINNIKLWRGLYSTSLICEAILRDGSCESLNLELISASTAEESRSIKSLIYLILTHAVFEDVDLFN